MLYDNCCLQENSIIVLYSSVFSYTCIFVLMYLHIFVSRVLVVLYSRTLMFSNLEKRAEEKNYSTTEISECWFASNESKSCNKSCGLEQRYLFRSVGCSPFPFYVCFDSQTFNVGKKLRRIFKNKISWYTDSKSSLK